MRLFQALKEKNKLIREANKIKVRVTANNSVDEGNTPAYNSEEQWALYVEKSKELNDLKVKISVATQPILPCIFEQAELKNQVTILKVLNVAEGVEHNRYGGAAAAIKKTAIIKAVTRDKMVEDLEAAIDKLQDEIDAFNASTDI